MVFRENISQHWCLICSLISKLWTSSTLHWWICRLWNEYGGNLSNFFFVEIFVVVLRKITSHFVIVNCNSLWHLRKGGNLNHPAGTSKNLDICKEINKFLFNSSMQSLWEFYISNHTVLTNDYILLIPDIKNQMH